MRIITLICFSSYITKYPPYPPIFNIALEIQGLQNGGYSKSILQYPPYPPYNYIKRYKYYVFSVKHHRFGGK